MAVNSNTGASVGRLAFAMAIDPASIITKVCSTREARSLPYACVVGDLQGGLTFTDDVAAMLESRSAAGWQEMQAPNGDVWTIIILNR